LNKEKWLESVEKIARTCCACSLCENRIKSVFHKGNPNAEIAFVGANPGEEENKTGIPFVGKSGMLLDSIIKAMGFNEDEVYILNACKCHSKRNRKPTFEEVNACKMFLISQLAIVKPRVIVALGATATESLLGFKGNLGDRIGEWHIFNDIPVRCTNHPSYLLREPNQKKSVWADMRQVLIYLGRIDK
jgi:DNA polymerase